MARSRKGGTDLVSDMAWAKEQLLAGRKCWCVRGRTGLVAMFITASQEDWKKFESWCVDRADGQPIISGLEGLRDQPLDNFTLTPVMLIDGEARFGVAGPWPGSAAHLQTMVALEERLHQLDSMALDINLAASRPRIPGEQ